MSAQGQGPVVASETICRGCHNTAENQQLKEAEEEERTERNHTANPAEPAGGRSHV